MKKIYLTAVSAMLMIAIIFLTNNPLYAQRIVNVAPGFGTLNDAIDDDAGWTEDTEYVLERDGIYLLNGSVTPKDNPATIVAADGTGARPFIQPGVDAGGESSRPFRAKNSLTLRGLHITSLDELGGLKKNMIRVSEDDARIIVDDCILDHDVQSIFRLDNENIKVYLTNSVVSRMGQLPTSGRVVDTRGNNTDSIVIENCTLYNISDRILRDDGAVINYAKFNQNTIVNVGRRLVFFGETITGIFTNNLVINPIFQGQVPGGELVGFFVDSLGQDLIDQGLVQNIDISYNNFYLSPTLTDLYPDTVGMIPMFNETAQAFIDASGNANTNISEAIEFVNPPVLPTVYIEMLYDGILDNEDDWDNTGAPHDFSHPASLSSTASDTGGCLGDLNWDCMVTGTEDVFKNKPFQLSNYPNPFSATTTIEYTLPNTADVSLSIYDAYGRKIASPVNAKQIAGAYKVNWDGSRNAKGIYYYQLIADDDAVNGKMILLDK